MPYSLRRASATPTRASLCREVLLVFFVARSGAISEFELQLLSSCGPELLNCSVPEVLSNYFCELAPTAVLGPLPARNAVDPKISWLKLAAMAEGAAIASSRLR